MQALRTLQLNCSDPLHALSDSKKYSETAVRKQTQWKPAVFAVKRFAVQLVSVKSGYVSNSFLISNFDL